jgi:hypothetical protein
MHRLSGRLVDRRENKRLSADNVRLSDLTNDLSRRLQTAGVAPRVEADLPNDQEFDQLMQIVCTAYPDLYDFQGLEPDIIPPSKKDLHDALREGFVSSFRALASPMFLRTAAPNPKLDISYAKVRVADLLRSQHRSSGNLSSCAFLMACVAIGDVPYSGFEPRFRHKGVVREVGLALPNHGGKVPDLMAWKRVLVAGKTIAASTPPWSPAEERKTVRLNHAQ